MSANSLEVKLRHRIGVLNLDLSFQTVAPWTVLFGASGSGKTTVLRTIAGFVRPEAGQVVFRGQSLIDVQRGLFVQADRRTVRSAGQAARLFQGMTVGGNLHYGASGHFLDEMVGLFRLDGLIDKWPHALSGGERQRVSVARAVASAAACPGALLLLDEPFGGLDFALRDGIAVDLRDWVAGRGVPVLSVTHDVGEAFLLNAEVIRIEGGRLTAQGPVAEVLAVERERLVNQLKFAGNTQT